MNQGTVDIFNIRFPLTTKRQVIDDLLSHLKDKKSLSVYFIDMHALNQMFKHPKIKEIYQREIFTLNDGAGLYFASWLQRKPFPDNLNGTDFLPAYFRAAPFGTKVFLVGSLPDYIDQSQKQLAADFPHLNFVGAESGFFEDENQVIAKIKTTSPDVVLVGMGNPSQVFFIDRHRSELNGVTWMAVGGFFDFYSGIRKRSPRIFRENYLEWLHIIIIQPHKTFRYLFGIPVFIARTFWAYLRNQHKAD